MCVYNLGPLVMSREFQFYPNKRLWLNCSFFEAQTICFEKSIYFAEMFL